MATVRKSITQEVTEKILATVLAHRNIDERLPSETALAQQFEVSRVTVREALSSLERRGIIVRKQGRGTFVNPNIPDISRIQTHIGTHLELTRLIELSGSTPHTTLLKHQRGTTEKWIAERLEIADDAPALSVHKLFSADDDPAVYMIYVVPLELEICTDAPLSIEDADPEIQIYQLLADCFGETVAYQVAGIEAEAVNAEIAAQLGCQAGDPVLCIEEVGYNLEDRPILYSRGFYRPGMIHFSLIRKPI